MMHINLDVHPCPLTGLILMHIAGVEKIHGLGDLSEYEKAALKAMLPELISQIEKGVDFVKTA